MMEYRNSKLTMGTEEMTLAGVVVPYGVTSPITPKFSEVFTPGSLQFSDVILNRQHDRAATLARTPGNLTLEDDARALTMTARLLETRLGKDTYQEVRSGLLRGLSVEMQVLKDSWSEMEGENRMLRTIHKAELHNIAVVDHPAHQTANVEARQELETRAGYHHIETWPKWT